MGVVVVHPYPGKSLFLDAMSGNELTPEELHDRENNKAYDYEHRQEYNIGRRYPVPSIWALFIAPICCFLDVLEAIIRHRHIETATPTARAWK